MPPRTVGPYELLSIAGRGGVGTVYRARDRRSGLPVAVKLLAPPPAADPSSARRLAREFEALRTLDHPNVVRVLEAGVWEGYSFLAMELVEGLDLRSYLSPTCDLAPRCPEGFAQSGESLPTFSDEPSSGPWIHGSGAEAILAFALRLDEPDTAELDGPPPAPVDRATDPAPRPTPPPPPREVCDLLNAPARVERLRDALLQVCAGLSHVHGRGLVHRDLKPSNIMVDDRRRVRLMDFGLVKLAREAPGALGLHGKVVGTYRYMAPEQARGLHVDLRADLYSLGVILFELLCGRPPFLAERPAELWQEITARPPPSVLALNPGADPRLALLAERLLQKDPAERLQLADAVAAELAA